MIIPTKELKPYADERNKSYYGLAKVAKTADGSVSLLFSYETLVAMWDANLQKFTLFETYSNPCCESRTGASNFSMTTRKHVKTFYRMCKNLYISSWQDVLNGSDFVICDTVTAHNAIYNNFM